MWVKIAKQRVASDRGATALTYGLTVGLVAIGALGAVTRIGDSVESLFGDVSNQIVSGINKRPTLTLAGGTVSEGQTNAEVPNFVSSVDFGDSLNAGEVADYLVTIVDDGNGALTAADISNEGTLTVSTGHVPADTTAVISVILEEKSDGFGADDNQSDPVTAEIIIANDFNCTSLSNPGPYTAQSYSFSIPEEGVGCVYQFQVSGAGGGGGGAEQDGVNASRGGNGGLVTFDFVPEAATAISGYAGQRGGGGPHPEGNDRGGSGGGGGGASTVEADGTVIAVAGGGGGGGGGNDHTSTTNTAEGGDGGGGTSATWAGENGEDPADSASPGLGGSGGLSATGGAAGSSDGANVSAQSGGNGLGGSGGNGGNTEDGVGPGGSGPSNGGNGGRAAGGTDSHESGGGGGGGGAGGGGGGGSDDDNGHGAGGGGGGAYVADDARISNIGGSRGGGGAGGNFINNSNGSPGTHGSVTITIANP